MVDCSTKKKKKDILPLVAPDTSVTNTGSGSIATVAIPTFSPAAGLYTTAQNISIISSTSGANIYYTIDGSTPTTSSTVYSSTVHIWLLAGKTIKAFATKSGMTDSGALSGIFSYPPIKTGQTSCYDGANNPIACSVTYKGQDAQESQGIVRSYTGPTAHATYTNDYTTTDYVTGLVWKSCLQGLSGATCATGSVAILTWANAEADATNGCSALNLANSSNGYAGKKNWRLPTIQELSTIADMGKTSAPTIDATSFPNTALLDSWSSTTNALNTANAFSVNVSDTNVTSYGKTTTARVRCVAGSQKDETKNYTDNGDGTVKDNGTGLIWQKCSGGLNNDTSCSGTASTYTWANAHTYCNSLSLASKAWRLPNRNELQGIVDYTKATLPTIDVTAFPNTQSNLYWSSTTNALTTANASYVGFNSGGVLNSAKTTATYNVRCVSGP